MKMASSGFSNAQNTSIAMAQNAASQLASAVRTGANPLTMFSQAADTGDKIVALIQSVTSSPPPSDQKN